MKYKVLDKRRDNIYQILLVVGLLLIVWEITIFRKTVVSLSLLLSIIACIGIATTSLDFKNFKNTYDLQGWKLYFFVLIQNILSWGFIACSILVLSNYYLSEGQPIEKTYEIVETSSMPGNSRNRSKRKPLVRINYEGEIKELVFSSQYYHDLGDYKFVTITTKKGRLNWDIILNQKLLNHEN